MKLIIDKTNYHHLIEGASILTTGGGVPIKDQFESIAKLGKFKINLVPLSELSDGDFLFTAAELGPSNAPPIKKNKIIKKLFNILKQITGKNLAAVYPCEIGQESIALETAHYLNLPIADFDPTGFRAVPFIDINIFSIIKNPDYSLTPVVLCNDKEEIFVLDGKIEYERVEEILRELTRFSNTGLVFLLCGVVKADSLKKIIPERRSYSLALEYGKTKSQEQLIKLINPKKYFSAKIVGKKALNQQGFFAEVISLKAEKDLYKLAVLNEAIFLTCNKKIVAEVPERILLIDPNSLNGIPSGNLKLGKEILVMVCDPVKEWNNIEAKKIFGRKRFSFLLGKAVQHD